MLGAGRRRKARFTLQLMYSQIYCTWLGLSGTKIHCISVHPRKLQTGERVKEDKTLYGGRRATGTQNSEEIFVVGTQLLLLQPGCVDPSTDSSTMRKELSFRNKFLFQFHLLIKFYTYFHFCLDLISILDVPFQCPCIHVCRLCS
jgi:hypothetical protein